LAPDFSQKIAIYGALGPFAGGFLLAFFMPNDAGFFRNLSLGSAGPFLGRSAPAMAGDSWSQPLPPGIGLYFLLAPDWVNSESTRRISCKIL
jgi:hypothetical protein